MKKIITTQKESEIQLDEVSYEDVILVKKKGNEYGVMYYDKAFWHARTSKNEYSRTDISDLTSWFGANCEFYVID